MYRITIRNNRFMPYPTGLEHWGVYFVLGVSDFTIEANRFGPAGEDAITIWHSDHGLIANNACGGNGEDLSLPSALQVLEHGGFDVSVESNHSLNPRLIWER